MVDVWSVVYVVLSYVAIVLLKPHVWGLYVCEGHLQKGEGRVVLVTGAASGVGEATVRSYVSKGFRVFACDVNAAGLEELAKDLGPTCIPLQLDVTSEEAIQNAFRVVEQKAGRLDVLVNCAGVLQDGPVLDVPAKAVRFMMEVNVVGPMMMTQTFMPLLLRSKASVVNICSLAGMCAWPWAGAYSVSKHALNGYTDLVRRECAGFGVRFICINPGGINTPMTEGMAVKIEAWAANHPQSIFMEKMNKFKFLVSGMSLAQTFCLLSREEVARTIHYVSLIPRPRARYVLGRPQVVWSFFAFMPTALADLLLSM